MRSSSRRRNYAWLWPFAVTLIPAALAVFYGLALPYLPACCGRTASPASAALAFGFGVAEWLRSFALHRFSVECHWLCGDAGSDPDAVGFRRRALRHERAAVFAFALPSALSRRRAGGRALAAVLVAGLLGVHAGYGYWRLDNAESRLEMTAPLVRIVQPAIDQSRKMGSGKTRRNIRYD
jgi:apolipoprotein N-acyltransferase